MVSTKGVLLGVLLSVYGVVLGMDFAGASLFGFQNATPHVKLILWVGYLTFACLAVVLGSDKDNRITEQKLVSLILIAILGPAISALGSVLGPGVMEVFVVGDAIILLFCVFVFASG